MCLISLQFYGGTTVCETGIEVAGKVVTRVSVRKDINLKNPMIVSEGNVFTIVSAKTLDEAVKSAVSEMVNFVGKHSNTGFEELVMLFSIVGHTEISQIVDPLVTARFRTPMNVLLKFGMPHDLF